VDSVRSREGSEGGGPLGAKGELGKGKGVKGNGTRTASHLGARVMPSPVFLSSYADVSRTRTLTGYNPMLEDYTNTRFLIS
jgi:hypothetical protein